MELLEPLLHHVKIPISSDKVYKDECVFSFDNPVCIKMLGYATRVYC